jgi:hypothetical protein
MVGITIREDVSMEKGRTIELERSVAPWEVSKGH